MKLKSVCEFNLSRLILFLLWLFIGPSPAWAKIFFVRLENQNFTFALPARAHESAEQALNEYIDFIRNHSDLNSELPLENIRQMKIRSVENIADYDLKPKLLVLANRYYDQSPVKKIGPQERIDKILGFLDGQSHAIVLPVAATGRFDTLTKMQIHNELQDMFDGAMALGGADVTPTLYNEKTKGARRFNFWRDYYELQLIKDWIADGQKALFGICRGHQLVASALGFKLDQHIVDHGDGQWVHHQINILKTWRSRLFNLFSDSKPVVASYHHQRVRSEIPQHLKEKLEIAALAEDGTIESLESKDGRIWTFQFHPEFLAGRTSQKIFKTINSILFDRYTHQSSKIRSCQALF